MSTNKKTTNQLNPNFNPSANAMPMQAPLQQAIITSVNQEISIFIDPKTEDAMSKMVDAAHNVHFTHGPLTTKDSKNKRLLSQIKEVEKLANSNEVLDATNVFENELEKFNSKSILTPAEQHIKNTVIDVLSAIYMSSMKENKAIELVNKELDQNGNNITALSSHTRANYAVTLFMAKQYKEGINVMRDLINDPNQKEFVTTYTDDSKKPKSLHKILKIMEDRAKRESPIPKPRTELSKLMPHGKDSEDELNTFLDKIWPTPEL